jgi:hypothetical protein
MLKMKHIIYFLAIGMTFLASCNKLHETAYSNVSPQSFFTTKNDVNAALVAMYRPLQNCCGGPEQAGTFVLNLASDEGTSNNSLWSQYDNLTYTPGSASEVHDMWGSYYQSISSANFVLDNEKKIDGLFSNVADANAKLAEAKFMRATDYFQLVQMFGGVPLRTTLVTRQDQTNIPRASVDSVYSLIISDLQYAEQNLPLVADLSGKPTKWAASAYLAKVYLTQKDFKDALAKASDVVANGPYKILPSFASIFDVNNKNNAEVIFTVEYIRLNGQGMRMQDLVMGPYNPFAYQGTTGWGLSNAESSDYAQFNPADDRVQTTFAPYVNKPAGKVDSQYIGKWRDVQGVSADGHGTDFILYRFADVVLEQAEAENEVNGPTAVAYAAINKIRERALMPDLTPGLSQSAFRDSVLQERKLELNWEEWRWFDLKRTGNLKSALIADGKTWDDRYYLFPIPQTEIDASNKLITQNPGY